MDVDGPRLREVDAVVSRARDLGAAVAGVRAVVVVGSYAYGRPTMQSDVDVVIAVDDREPWLTEEAWAARLLGEPPEIVREEDWGPLRERRFRTGSGLEVEVGLVTGAWYALPVDPGTARVLTDGCRVVTDPDGLVHAALRSLSLPTVEWSGALDGSSNRGDTGPHAPR